MLNESIEKQASLRHFDIFLSHAFADAEVVLGIKLKLESYGNSVYVDWIDDPKLDRSSVNSDTAEVLKERMDDCSALFWATSDSSSQSKWMPWECGYFDGKKEKVAILPVTEERTNSYSGQEYLGLYPFVLEGRYEGESTDDLFIRFKDDSVETFTR